MNCSKCSAQYNLGLNKPVKLCCSLMCYSCTYIEKSRNSSCPACLNAYPSLSSLSVDLNLLESLWKSSILTNQLKATQNYSVSGNCNLCKSNKATKSFTKMKSGLCESCSLEYFMYKAPVEQLRCANGHRFIHTDLEAETGKKCSLCKIASRNNTHCLYCNVHVCQLCSDMLKETINCLKFVRCSCSGTLIWQDFKKCKSCAGCKEGNASIGRFFCLNCSKTFCVFCVNLMFEVLKCNSCAVEFSQSLKPVILDREKLFCRPCSEGLTNVTENRDLVSIFNKKCKGSHNFVKLNGTVKNCKICKGPGEVLCYLCQFIICKTCLHWIENSELTTERCLKGHFLRKTQISAELYKNSKFSCRTCTFPVQKTSYFCKSCSVDQCEDCYYFFNKLKTEKIVLSCTCGGFFAWLNSKPCEKCSSCGTKYPKSGSFSCQTCKKSSCVPCQKILSVNICVLCKNSGANGEVSLRKLPCKHHLCFICYELTQSSPSPYCPLDQTELTEPLQLQRASKKCEIHNFKENYQFKTLCQVCLKMKDNLNYCDNCYYLVCKACKKWVSESSPIVPEFLCLSNHELRLTPKAEKFYDRNGKFKCDGCSELKHGNSAHCLVCKIDYCQACWGSIQMLNMFFEVFGCGCKGSIVWDRNKAGSSCVKCKKKYGKAGFFGCKGCEKIWCIKCAAGVRSEGCNVCGKLFLKNGKVPFLAYSGQIVCDGCLGGIGSANSLGK